MRRDSLRKCLAWTELLHTGEMRYSKALDPLLATGLALRRGSTVVLLEESTLSTIVNTQCREMIRIRDEARELARSMGLEVTITSRPDEALALLQRLQASQGEPLDACSCRDMSAGLFNDSKHIERVPVLSRIYSEWARGRHLRGELRLKAYGRLVHRAHGLDLGEVTRALGQVCIPAQRASRLNDYDLSRIGLVLTSENLAPFEQMSPNKGLVLFCPGYNTGLAALWLGSLPAACPWVHFGDFDPDGLAIFERLSLQSGRKGRFVPDLDLLERLRASLPAWSGARAFDPKRYTLQAMQELAAWGRENEVFAEQEQVLQLLGWQEVCGLDAQPHADSQSTTS